MFKKTLLAGALGAAMLTAALPQTALAENTLRMAYDADPVSLDIHEQLSGGILQLSHMAFDPLVRWTKDFEFEPRLATEWEQVDDTTMRISLREGVTFHSGNPFTAEDVAFAMSLVEDPQVASPRISSSLIITPAVVNGDSAFFFSVLKPLLMAAKFPTSSPVFTEPTATGLMGNASPMTPDSSQSPLAFSFLSRAYSGVPLR